MIQFLMPSLGADMEDGILVEWRKKPGDEVKRGDIIAEVETQKGLIEIEIFDEGIIEQLLVEEGKKVPVGTPLALIRPEEEVSVSPKEVIPEIKLEEEIHPILEKVSLPKQNEAIDGKRIKVSPLARKIAEENHIDLSQIIGSGENSAITREDVEKAIASKKKKSEEKPQEIQAEQADKVKNAANSIRAAVAAAMSKSNREIPHYYLEKKIDMSKALTWLNEANQKRSIQKRLLPAALLVKSVACALEEVPELNAVWDNGLKLKKEINIGFVVSLRGGGVIVPAIHRANLKSIDEIMENLNDLIPRARALKLRSSELSDSSITLTSMGERGADTVFGVIYPPQVALVGFGSVVEQPFAENGMLGIRPVISLTLAGDHRATDGLTGSRLLLAIQKYLQNPDIG